MYPNMNTHYQVKNINGTSEDPYWNSESKYLNNGNKAGSWLEIWRDSTGSTRSRCARLGCSRTDLVGAHVFIVDGRISNEWYIVPICKSSDCNHHSNTIPMFIESTCPLVSVRRYDGKHIVR